MCTGLEIIALLGTAASAAGAYQQGQAAKKAADFNSAMAMQNAALSRKQAAEEERRFRVDARKRIGAMQAAYAAAGVTMEGSPTSVLAEGLYTTELDALTIREGGAARTSAYQMQAQLDTMQGTAANEASYYSAASELLTGGTTAYKMAHT